MPRTATKKSAKTPTAKSKAPTKRKAPVKAKAATTRAKKASSKSAHKPKPAAKTKTTEKKAAPKVARKSKTAKSKLVSQDTFNPEQKARLINLIQIVVETRKRKQGGARSLARIDQVLAKHNQRFPNPERKFDATIEIGMQFGNPQNQPHVYAPNATRNADEVALYDILQEMSKGKLGFEEAENKLSNIPSNSGEKKS